MFVDGENGLGCSGTMSMLSFELSNDSAVGSLVTLPLTNCSVNGISTTLEEVDCCDEHDNKIAEEMTDVAKVAINLFADTLDAFFMIDDIVIRC
jgi:hypothetical protein